MQGCDSIEFLAKYKDWLAVKKISITNDTKPEEIVLQLAGIRQSLDRKAFEMIILRYQQPLLNYLGRLTGDREQAQDFTQEAGEVACR
jgi:hypothetical protein